MRLDTKSPGLREKREDSETATFRRSRVGHVSEEQAAVSEELGLPIGQAGPRERRRKFLSSGRRNALGEQHRHRWGP